MSGVSPAVGPETGHSVGVLWAGQGSAFDPQDPKLPQFPAININKA